MQIISGKTLSNEVKEKVAAKVAALKAQGRRIPVLSVILVGDNPASQSYVRSKARGCEQVGIENKTIVLPENTTQEELEAVVKAENENPQVDGILVQLPLPSHLNEDAIIHLIDPDKDVDGLHPLNAGRLVCKEKGLVPCTPKGVMYMLESIGLSDLSGLQAAVLGRSRLVGKPVASLLEQKNATVTTIHSRTKNPKEIVRHADIVVAAIGSAEYVDADWIQPGAVIIDVGINRTEQGLKGDVNFESVKDVASAITPVPGGVGLMTVAMLLDNTLQAYALHEGDN